MIITTDEVKAILGISDTSKDTAIDTLIPIVQDFVLTYCNNHFEIERSTFYNIYTKSSNSKTFHIDSYRTSFLASTLSPVAPAKILNVEGLFVVTGFLNAAHVWVQGSMFNDGVYKLGSVLPGEASLATGEVLIDEPVNNNLISLCVVSFPKGIKLPVANLINFHLIQDNAHGKQSESTGEYSYTALPGGKYPDSLLAGLNVYKKIKFT